MFAAAEGQTGVVQILLDAGADPLAADVDGEDAELFARHKGHPETADLIRAAKEKAKGKRKQASE
jgi:ankyrin repeat protein